MLPGSIVIVAVVLRPISNVISIMAFLARHILIALQGALLPA